MPVRGTFYSSKAWRDLRSRILDRDAHQCQIRLPICQGTATEVDHIIPRSVDPDLAMVPSNLRAACKQCNQVTGGRLGAARAKRASKRTKVGRADGFAAW